MTFIQDFRTRAAQRARYRATLRELNSLSEAEARDIGIAKGDVRRIAWQAVYGG